MIPKIIHYCWFGESLKPVDIQNNLHKWSDLMPDYKIMEWNEKNFPFSDINNDFFQQAVIHKDWAFVSDYVRLIVLKKYGGIYLDTDVQVLQKFDSYLDNIGFLGFENIVTLSSAIIGSSKDSEFIQLVLAKYSNLKYSSNKKVPNVTIITNVACSLGLNFVNSQQKLSDGTKIYPQQIFSPKNYITQKVILTEDTVTIHNFNASWVKQTGIKYVIKKFIYFLIGDNYYKIMRSIYEK